MSKSTITYYISTGAKNAMYTLRMSRELVGEGMYNCVDFYVCTLAAHLDRAVAKAEAYFEALKDRVQDIELCTDPEYVATVRRGKLSVKDTKQIEMIEEGFFPFGKMAGQRIDSAPDSYLLYFADMAKKTPEGAVICALIAACTGVALERGAIAKREAKREEQRTIDLQSEFVGEIGKRQEFEGTPVLSLQNPQPFDNFGAYWINKIRCGNDLVTYIGSKSLGQVGTQIKMKATVKKHSIYSGVKSTEVSRPAII